MPKLAPQDQRIAAIFGTEDVPDVTTATLERYRAYLQQHLELPCQLTGIEDFAWEEYYVIGPGSKAEHERLPDVEKFPVHFYEDGITSLENALRLRQIGAFEHWQGHTEYTLGDILRKVSTGGEAM